MYPIATMSNNIITVLVLLCEILSGLALKNSYIIKLENVKRTYVNDKLMEYNVEAIPFNNTFHYLNMTTKFKFKVKENILFDSSCYRITKFNRSFPIAYFNMIWKDILSMEQFGTEALWTEYTRPPLLWPPQVNVTYRTFGWVPDVSKFPPQVIPGKIKLNMTLMLLNHTRLYSSDWAFNII